MDHKGASCRAGELKRLFDEDEREMGERSLEVSQGGKKCDLRVKPNPITTSIEPAGG